MPRLLAIDYGLKRTGLAVSDPMRIIATALQTIPTAELMDFLKKYDISEGVEAFVVGMPSHLDGNPTHATPLVEIFVKLLHQNFPDKPVHLIDERFTSKIAMQAMIAGGMKKKDRRKKENVDKIAAVILLQDFMERIES
jgi:putative holliday junction resolvase